MSISSIFGTTMPLLKPISSSSYSPRMGTAVAAPPPLIECSSRPQKKGTAHHRKTRPKKSQPWDIKRRPTVYAPLPKLPPEWTLATASDTTESVVAPPPTSTETTTTTTED